MLKSSIQHRILKTLSDDRPITAIQVIENLEKCPRGFYPISRTYDQDQDADLRESSIFKSNTARYLCLSKTEGLPNFVIQELFILNDKFNIPKGFSLLNRTADSEQKAWKKKQLCYRLVNTKETKIAITDIIVCSRLKKAPEGFRLVGEFNGVTICFKMGNIQDTQQVQKNSLSDRPPLNSNNGGVYPQISGDGSNDHDYEILLPGYNPNVLPSRPAPKPPAIGGGNTNTLGSSLNYLDGVPFVINPKFFTSTTSDRLQFPVIKAKSLQQIIKEYDYPFTVEKQT